MKVSWDPAWAPDARILQKTLCFYMFFRPRFALHSLDADRRPPRCPLGFFEKGARAGPAGLQKNL